MRQESGDSPLWTAGFLEESVVASLERQSAALTEVSQAVWSHPELNYQEHFACKTICEYLEKEGFPVERNYCGIETSFLAQFTTGDFQQGDSGRGPTIAILLEYDALPEIGHACGHNLITEAGLGAFVAICGSVKKSSFQGKVFCMGTPAEEGGGGKVKLLQAGAFKNVDFAMMVHPAPVDLLEPAILGVNRLKVEFTGKAAHASCGPWEGVNALDAAVAAYNNISLLRQHLPPGNQVHMTVLHGGAKPNIIPDFTSSSYMYRAPTKIQMEKLRTRVENCIHAAGKATGCSVKIDDSESLEYEPLMSNAKMLEVYKHFAFKHGQRFPAMRPSYGSTDMGNVSLQVPSIHPAFNVGELIMIHTKEFAGAANKPAAHSAARRAGLAMAMTTLELLANPELRQSVKDEFLKTRETFVGSAFAENTSGFHNAVI